MDLVKIHMEEAQDTPENEIYEDMLTASQNFISDFDNEDIYESMMKLNPDMGLCKILSFKQYCFCWHDTTYYWFIFNNCCVP